VPQDERKSMTRRHTIESKPDVCMTDSATRDLDDNSVRAGIESREFARLQRSIESIQPESIRALNAGHHGILPDAEAISTVREA
jgi:hypothetical protein